MVAQVPDREQASELVASSMIQNRGYFIAAAPIINRYCSPPDSLMPRGPTLVQIH